MSPVPVRTSPIRPLDVRKDLAAVADLIELCFSNQMDIDGREYVRHIRRAAADSSYLRWVRGAAERVSIPLHGYVWVEDTRIVGNLTLIPFWRGGSWRYLIANVAVHPEYRRRGIGRLLTEKALEHVRDHGASSAWLQVRQDNPAAYNLYLSLGFIERAWRTTWQCPSEGRMVAPVIPSVEITRRTHSDWTLQSTWLAQNYPPEVAWNLPFSKARLSPSLWQRLQRYLNNEPMRHYAAHQHGQLIGVATWEPGPYHTDLYWLAAPPETEDLAVAALFQYVRKYPQNGRTITVNYPAGRAVRAFETCGFHAAHTLIWMEVRFPE